MDTGAVYSFEFGSFYVDTVRRLLLREGQSVPIKPKAFDVLVALVDSPGFVSKRQLMERVWPNSFVEEANIHHNISILRKLLGQSGQWIATVHGQGYRFVAEVRRIANANGSPIESGSEQGNAQADTAVRALLETLGLARRGGAESGRVSAVMAEIRVRPGGLTLEIEIPGLRAKPPATEGRERHEDQIDANPAGRRGRRRPVTAGEVERG
jgi:DNA-binding winged helix-turn-helix (wHTH) protein